VVVPISQWQKLQPPLGLKALLLAPEARGDLRIPKRGQLTSRKPPSFD
jgi:hypothetical protein